MYLSTLERKILNCIQEDIPLATQPFRILSHQLGITEKELLKNLKRLKDTGIIRRFSASVNHKKLKFKSTLLGLKVPVHKVNSLAKSIVNYPEVTHCYLRKGKYNLWVVFLYKNGKLKQFISELDRQIGKRHIVNLPTKRQFKLRTNLKL